MSFAIPAAVVVPIAETICSFLFGRLGNGILDNALIRRKTKRILSEDKKKIKSLFIAEPDKAKAVEEFLFTDIFQDQVFLYPVSSLPEDRVELVWDKYRRFTKDYNDAVSSTPEDKTLLIECINNHNALVGKQLLNNSDRLILGVLERDRSDVFGYIGKTLNSDSDLQYSNDRLDYAHKQIEGILHALRMDQRHYKILLALYSVGLIGLSVALVIVFPGVLPELTRNSWSFEWTFLFVLIIGIVFISLFAFFMKSYQRVTKYENRIAQYVEALWKIHFRCYEELFSQIYSIDSQVDKVENDAIC